MQMRETRWRTTEMTMTQPVSVVLVLSRVKRVVQRLSGEVLLSRRRESRLRYHFDSHDISSVESPWSKLTWKFLIPCTWGRKEMLDSRKRLRLSMTWTSSAQHGLSHVYEWLTFHLQKKDDDIIVSISSACIMSRTEIWGEGEATVYTLLIRKE